MMTPNDATVHEAKELKTALEHDVRQALQEFHNQTGLYIVHLRINYASTMDGKVKYMRVEAEAHLE